MSRDTRHGFSLLELSVVLAIISIVMVMGISMGSDALKAANRISTQQRLATIQQALDTYAQINGHLPCPASRADTPSTANFGMERITGATCSVLSPGLVSVVDGGGAVYGYIGGVPVRSLSLPDSYAGDAWGDKFTYAVSARHIMDNTSYATQDGTLTVEYGDRSGTHYSLTSSTNHTNGTQSYGSGTTYTASATYVVISHGPDGRGAYPVNGTSAAIACKDDGSNDYENCDDINGIFYDTAYNDGGNANQHFDDYVVWGSNALQRLPITTPGTAGSYEWAGCPPNSCDPWCAACTYNYIGKGAGDNPMNDSPTSLGNPKLCQKVVSSPLPCQSNCFWGNMVPTNIARCPCPGRQGADSAWW